MARTYRRKTACPRQWVRNRWADHGLAWDEAAVLSPQGRARFYMDWRSQPNTPPRMRRRQIEGSYRQKLRHDLQQILADRQEDLTPFKWAKGIGWFWGW